MTFTPAVNSDGSYDAEGGTWSTGRDGGRCDAVYEENEITGERQYLVTEQEQRSDLDYQRDTDEEYISNIIELYPNIQQMLAFGKEYYPPEFVIDFNNAMNGEDDGERWQFLELLDQDFRDAHPEVASVQEETTVAEDVTQAEIDEVLDPMLQEEPAGLEMAYQWLQAAEDSQESNPVYSAVCAATASFHNSEMSAEEAISSVLENYPLDEVIKIYRQLSS